MDGIGVLIWLAWIASMKGRSRKTGGMARAPFHGVMGVYRLANSSMIADMAKE